MMLHDEQCQVFNLGLLRKLMQALTTRDVELLIEGGATVTDLKLICVQHKGKAYYQIEFVLNARGSSKKSMLITTRSEPHRWVDLNRAVAFVSQLFPENHEIRLITHVG